MKIFKLTLFAIQLVLVAPLLPVIALMWIVYLLEKSYIEEAGAVLQLHRSGIIYPAIRFLKLPADSRTLSAG